MKHNILLPLSLILAIKSSQPIAVRQILQEMYFILDFELSKKLLLRILPLLTPKERDFFRSVSN